MVGQTSFLSGAAGKFTSGHIGANIQYAANALTSIKLAFSAGNIAAGYMTVNKLD